MMWSIICRVIVRIWMRFDGKKKCFYFVKFDIMYKYINSVRGISYGHHSKQRLYYQGTRTI